MYTIKMFTTNLLSTREHILAWLLSSQSTQRSTQPNFHPCSCAPTCPTVPTTCPGLSSPSLCNCAGTTWSSPLSRDDRIRIVGKIQLNLFQPCRRTRFQEQNRGQLTARNTQSCCCHTARTCRTGTTQRCWCTTVGCEKQLNKFNC